MSITRFEFAPGIVLDARRAVWFAAERTLAVADLHLGFAWSHRAAGTLLPLGTPDDTLSRLRTLVQEYQPAELLVLGDIVHRAVSLAPVRAELEVLHTGLGEVRLRLLAGNHDRGLPAMLRASGFPDALAPHVCVGPHFLLHGDAPPPEAAFTVAGARIFMGHEHPAISVGDGIAGLKCPCFLVGPRVVVLPAFTTWAAGSGLRRGGFLSALAREEPFHRAVAILAGKLLPLPLRTGSIVRA